MQFILITPWYMNVEVMNNKKTVKKKYPPCIECKTSTAQQIESTKHTTPNLSLNSLQF